MTDPDAPLLTIGRLARAAGLARGTLLHYEALGLLAARGRSGAGYRLYGADEAERLQAIRRYRDAGLSLADIRALLARPPGGAAGLLEQRLLGLSAEIQRLRAQQRHLARLLALAELRAPLAGKAAWVALLRRAGFADDEMRRWHADFEADDPAGHGRFLRALGLAAAEVAAVRGVSRSPARR